MNYEKAADKLGWNPEYNFSTGLTETILWYKENPTWWKEIKSGAYMEYYDKHYGKKG